MLIVVQFPIADFRPFQSQHSDRLLTPNWPPRVDLPPEFLHFFGPAMPRHRGIDWAWTDEQAFCRANRALRFERLPEISTGWKGQVRCAFRRLLSDGEAVTRLEIGLSCNNLMDNSLRWKYWDSAVDMGKDPTIEASDINPLDMVEHIGGLRTKVPLSNDAADGNVRPLILQGRSIAKLFLRASSGIAGKENLQPWHQLVGVGAPVMFIECRAHWNEELPRGFVHIEPDKVGEVDLAFGRKDTPWGRLCVWLLGHGKARTMSIRNLRLCLLRLHAEQEVLDSVLDHINTGALPYVPHSDHGDRLEVYLNKATRLIDRNRWAGIDQSAILQAFDAAEATENRAVRVGLSKQLLGVRRQIRKKLERFEAREFPRTERHLHFHDNASYINKVETMDTKTINIGDGATINAPVTIADQIENSFNVLEKASADPQLKELVRQLLKQIAQVSESAPDKTNTMAADAEVLSKEVARDTPRRKWYELSVQGIKEAAEALGEIGKPILDTTAKLLPLLVALFP